jgi:phosphatidylglycerophosphate synthase
VARLYLLSPALVLSATLLAAFVVFCGLRAIGKAQVIGVKHNQLIGPFLAGFLVWFLHPIEHLLVRRVSPNAITLASLAVCGVTGIAIAEGYLGDAVWLYAIAGILDVLDGRIARLAGKQTKTGALLDSVSDRWGELFVFTGCAWYLHETVWLLAVMAAIGGSMMVSYTRARAEGLGVELSGGMMQRAERIVLVAGGTFLAAWYECADPTGTDPMIAQILGGTLLLCGIASSATAINRWIVAHRALAAREAAPALSTAPEAARSPAAVRPAIALSSTGVRDARPLEQH